MRSVTNRLYELLAGGMKPGLLGLVVPPGHAVTDVEAKILDRALIRFAPG